MKKLVYVTVALSTAFTALTALAMTTPQQQETQRKLNLVQYFNPIARLAPTIKLQLLLSLLPQLQENDIDQILATYKASGTLQNPDALKKLFMDLRQQAVQTSPTPTPTTSAQTLQQKVQAAISHIQTQVKQILTTALQRFRPEERAGLVLYLAHALPATTIQASRLSDTAKSALSQLGTQVTALKKAIQTKYAPHLQQEIAKHEQEIVNQTETDTP